MNIMYSFKFWGGVLFLYACGGVWYAIGRWTPFGNLSAVQQSWSIVVIMTFIPIGLLVSGKFRIQDKRLAFIGAGIWLLGLMLMAFITGLQWYFGSVN